MKRVLKNKRVQMLLLAISIVSVTLTVTRGYEVVINHSKSLSINGVLVDVGQIPNERDQLFAFHVRNSPTYKSKDVIFVKKLGGLPGDEIEIKDRDFYVAGKLIGTAKAVSLKGNPLEMIQPGKIPPHKFFAYAEHSDSNDSRYTEIGLVDEKDIMGTAVFAF